MLLSFCFFVSFFFSPSQSKRKDSEPRTKCLLNNAEITPHHPKDPVEMRRINFQTPGNWLQTSLSRWEGRSGATALSFAPSCLREGCCRAAFETQH